MSSTAFTQPTTFMIEEAFGDRKMLLQLVYT